MAATGTEMLHFSDGRAGDAAVGIGGTLVSPSLPVGQMGHYFGDIGGFPAITELIGMKS